MKGYLVNTISLAKGIVWFLVDCILTNGYKEDTINSGEGDTVIELVYNNGKHKRKRFLDYIRLVKLNISLTRPITLNPTHSLRYSNRYVLVFKTNYNSKVNGAIMWRLYKPGSVHCQCCTIFSKPEMVLKIW